MKTSFRFIYARGARLLHAAALLFATFASGSAMAATVSGQVLDLSTQQPIAGAEVSIYYPGALGWPTLVERTTTTADGRYSLTFPDQASVAGIARAPGHAARTQSGIPCTESPACANNSFVSLASGSATFGFALPRAAHLTGLVHDAETANAVGNALVHLVSTTSAQLTHTVHTDTAGRFHLDGLHPGSYTLALHGDLANPTGGARQYLASHWPQLHCDNVQVRCDGVTPGQIALAEGQTIDLDLPLRRGSYLRTRVISGGNQLPTFIHSASARSIAQPLTGLSGTDGGDDGYTWVGPLLPGPIHIVLESGYSLAYADVIYPNATCPSSGCDFSDAPVVEVPATDGVYTLDDVHVQPLRTIRGRVTSSVDSQPIAGLRVDAGNLRAPQAGTWGFRPTASTWTDANGEYALEGFDEAEVMVRTRQNGLGWLDQAWQNEDCDAANLFCQYDTQHVPLSFDLQPHPAGIDFVLGRGASLRGRVIEETTNRPLANYAVAVVPLAVLRTGKPEFTDADGNFRIDGLAPSAYYLFASAERVYGYTAGVIYPGGPCSFAVISNGLNSCFPTTYQPLEVPAGGVLEGLTIIMPRPDAIFRDPFDP